MSKKTLYAFIVSFLLLIGVIILNRLSFQEMRRYSDQIDHTRHVITVFESISNHFKSAQIYSPNTADSLLDKSLAWYKEESDSIQSELRDLRHLVIDNPSQKKRVDTLTSAITRELGALSVNNVTDLINAGQGWRVRNFMAIHGLINEGIEEEDNLLVTRKSRLYDYTRINNLLTTAFGVIAAGILIITFLSNFLLSKRGKWLEGFLESILNTSRNAIVHYTAVREGGKVVDLRLKFANKAVNKLFNINAEEYLGLRLSDWDSFTKNSPLHSRCIDVIQTGIPSELELYYDRRSRKCWLLVSLAKLDDGVIASFQDITQLKLYEQELKENISDLEKSNTELEQYAYVASHDLQEPLRKIRSFGSFLQDTQAEKLDEKGRQQLDKIISSAERMSVLIKDILNFSGLKKEESAMQTDLNQVLDNVLQDLDLMINQKKAHIRSQKLPVIQAIPLQMHQLFYNLINNSLKFSSHDHTPDIDISCRELPESEKPESLRKSIPYYELIFRDNGIGFSTEYSEQIFGLFKRLNDKQFYPGSGIGLALCKKVVDNHHGLILADGKEGEGAIFRIYLPKTQAPLIQAQANS